jgi:hypothetical protein
VSVRKYCVYVFIDQQTGEPIYIGKGDAGRAREHARPAALAIHEDNYFHRRLDILLQAGKPPKVELIKDSLTEEEAACSEAVLIHLIGTRATKTGPLYNLAAGWRHKSGYTLRKGVRPGGSSLSKEVTVWAEPFPSIAAAIRDPRCPVTIDCVRNRMRRGWVMGEAIATPPRSFQVWGERFPDLLSIAADPRCLVSARQLQSRRFMGWSLEKAASTPVQGRRKPLRAS